MGEEEEEDTEDWDYDEPPSVYRDRRNLLCELRPHPGFSQQPSHLFLCMVSGACNRNKILAPLDQRKYEFRDHFVDDPMAPIVEADLDHYFRSHARGERKTEEEIKAGLGYDLYLTDDVSNLTSDEDDRRTIKPKGSHEDSDEEGVDNEDEDNAQLNEDEEDNPHADGATDDDDDEGDEIDPSKDGDSKGNHEKSGSSNSSTRSRSQSDDWIPINADEDGFENLSPGAQTEDYVQPKSEEDGSD